MDLTAGEMGNNRIRVETEPAGGTPPQKDRRPRSIIDYSFYSINDDKVLTAPPEAM
jgi:hypothetical protein